MKGRSVEFAAPYKVNLKFKTRGEAQELAEELKSWTPTGGWSPQAQVLFELLMGRTSRASTE